MNKIYFCSWLREDAEGKEERRRKVNKETREEVGRKRKRKGEKGEDETVAAKRRCTNPVSAEASDIFSQGRIRIVVGILGMTSWVPLVVCLIVGLRGRRVCLL